MSTKKRQREEEDVEPQAGLHDSNASPAGDEPEDFGPAAPDVPPAKRRKVLKFHKLYLSQLPSSDKYERSFMHRDSVTHIAVAPRTDFIITASSDGHVKFWKKQPTGIEFVKHFRSHLGTIAISLRPLCLRTCTQLYPLD